MAIIISLCTTALLPSAHQRIAVVTPRRFTALSAVRMSADPDQTRDPEERVATSSYEQYLQQRGTADVERAQEEYLTSKTLRLYANEESEFDGGDSGSGAVGDGNVDLEDQHNSATLGGNRGGFSDLGGGTDLVGRGTVLSYADLPDESQKVSGATEARTTSAGKNYFGRSTGLADKLINDISEEDRKMGRMDEVRAQQKENWFNQRAIHAQNRAQGQGVVFGEEKKLMPREGGYNARETLASQTSRAGAQDGEVSQRDLANHLAEMATKATPRLDGEPWGMLTVGPTDEITRTFEVRASPRSTSVTTIDVGNDYNTFAPFQCNIAAGSSCFSVSPNHGSMNRRSGAPVELVVRYTPMETGVIHECYIVFETEDMKKVYHFVGSQ